MAMLRCTIVTALLGSCVAWTLQAGERIRAAPLVRPPSSVSGSGPASILDLAAAETWMAEHGLKEHHLLGVFRHLFRRRGALTAEALHADAGLPKAASAALSEAFVAYTSRVVERVPSEGGLKLVVELASGHRVETVLILHEHRSSGKRRCTVCVSSQVGCARACSFCATGTMGLRAQLSSAEILEQVWHAKAELRTLAADARAAAARDATAEDATAEEAEAMDATRTSEHEVRNIVFMGMGEPLDNYDALLASLRGLTHQALFDLSAKHLTVSTVSASATASSRHPPPPTAACTAATPGLCGLPMPPRASHSLT